ncbi:unnamed protein product [Closterium sp. NIES-53]
MAAQIYNPDHTMSAAKEEALGASGDDLAVDDLPEGMFHHLADPANLLAAKKLCMVPDASPAPNPSPATSSGSDPALPAHSPMPLTVAALSAPSFGLAPSLVATAASPNSPLADLTDFHRASDPYEDTYFTHLAGLPIATLDDPNFERIPSEIPLEDNKPPMLLNVSCHVCSLCANNHRASDHEAFAAHRRQRLTNRNVISVAQLQKANGTLLDNLSHLCYLTFSLPYRSGPRVLPFPLSISTSPPPPITLPPRSSRATVLTHPALSHYCLIPLCPPSYATSPSPCLTALVPLYSPFGSPFRHLPPPVTIPPRSSRATVLTHPALSHCCLIPLCPPSCWAATIT